MTADQIRDMIERLENDIREHGWDASIDGASCALQWVMQEDLGTDTLGAYMARPDGDRRREWIARGGDPKHWPETRQ